jgi:signal transduction histidine kinase
VAVIRSQTDMALLQVFPPEDYPGLFRSIHRETERLGRLISDLLALARADEGQVHLDWEALLFDQLVEAVTATADVLATEHGITLVVKTASPILVQGDEAHLMQVVMNLLENAIRYTDPGGQILVTVSATNTSACLVIRDSGIGIAPHRLPHLFDRFYRVDPARTRTKDGHSRGDEDAIRGPGDHLHPVHMPTIHAGDGSCRGACGGSWCQ